MKKAVDGNFDYFRTLVVAKIAHSTGKWKTLVNQIGSKMSKMLFCCLFETLEKFLSASLLCNSGLPSLCEPTAYLLSLLYVFVCFQLRLIETKLYQNH